MSRISKGKFRYLRSLFCNLNRYTELHCGKHRNTFVSEMATRGYYEGCRRLNNDVDIEFMITKAGMKLILID